MTRYIPPRTMRRIRDAIDGLAHIFKTSRSKHEANERAAPLMGQLALEPAFLTAVLEHYVRLPATFNRKNYPVLGIDIALNPWFGLVANCWIPHPERRTDVATKMIHHHGDMLLTTATMFGPGYEHWMFKLPSIVDRERGLYAMQLIESAPHPHGHVSFVDAWVAHTPLFPRSLSITLALWSRQFATTWRDRAKRLPLVGGNSARLTKLAKAVGLRKALQLNVVDSFDFYPSGTQFTVMQERKEFPLGPNEHHVQNVFHLLQATGNEHLGRVVREQLARNVVTTGRAPVERFLAALESGRPIDGVLSANHYDLPFANFTRSDIVRALGPAEKRNNHGGELHNPSNRQEAARTSAR